MATRRRDGGNGTGRRRTAARADCQTGGGPPPGWVFALALVVQRDRAWRVARLAER